MDEDKKFNSYTLTDEEFEKVIAKYISLIKDKTKKAGASKDDCMQEIIVSLHHTLTRNRKKNKKI